MADVFIEGVTDAGVTDIEGAGGKMVLPLLVAGASLLGGLYNVGRAYENKRYWDTYFKNTHRRPKYPYRAGYNDTWKYFTRALGNFSFVR